MIDGNAFGGGYPGYNFLQGMSGPGGFTGNDSPFLGQGFMQGLQQDSKKQNHGMNSLMMLSPLMGLLSQHGGMGAIAPLLGGLAGWGLHKAKVF